VDARHARNYQASRVSQRGARSKFFTDWPAKNERKPDYASPAFLHRQISDER